MYKRILILGGIGSGKSTFAKRVSLYTGYPVYHLDSIIYNSKGERAEKSDWERISQENFLSKDVGIVDGNYTSSLPNRINWADIVIFVDSSTTLQLYRYLRRIIKVWLNLEKRYGMAKGVKTIFRYNTIKWIFIFNRIEKKKIFSIFESIKDKKFVTIKNPREVNLKKLFISPRSDLGEVL